MYDDSHEKSGKSLRIFSALTLQEEKELDLISILSIKGFFKEKERVLDFIPHNDQLLVLTLRGKEGSYVLHAYALQCKENQVIEGKQEEGLVTSSQNRLSWTCSNHYQFEKYKVAGNFPANYYSFWSYNNKLNILYDENTHKSDDISRAHQMECTHSAVDFTSGEVSTTSAMNARPLGKKKKKL